MPIEVKHQSFADCETLTIFGAKRGKGNSTNLVRVQFSDLDDLKEFQNKLNNLFPENVIINEKIQRTKRRSVLPLANWNTALKRRMGVERHTIQGLHYTILGMEHPPHLHLINRPWNNVIEQLTKVALPLTRVNITPFSE